uniref:helix-turn-helix domain-containing protein n=2 Tax=Desulfovibrio cuneatus TaxID=159728 RepID=UPI0012EC3D4E
MHYTHLAKEERYYIFCSLKSGKSMRTIARELNRSTATVSREYARNKGLRGYRYQQAERKSQERQAHKGKTQISPTTWLAVE